MERFGELVLLFRPQIGSAEGKTKEKAVAERDSAFVAAVNASPREDSVVQAAADAQRTVAQVRANTALSLFAINSFVASILCGGVGLLLLKAVGLTTLVPVDIAITSLAIGGGSQQLHDLLKLVRASKEKAQDQNTTTSPT